MADNTENKKKQAKDAPHDTVDTHEYDGIKELNNPPPAWIIIIFLVTIGFALFYLVRFFGYPGNEMDQTSVYERSVAQAEADLKQKKAETSGSEVEMTLEEILAEGKRFYTEQGCLACHGVNGEGNTIGPNLADNFWIHGCSEEAVSKVISKGVVSKGMTAFGNRMTEEQIGMLSKYILEEMHGSEPENAKEPQGEECN